jgi:citrate synthase
MTQAYLDADEVAAILGISKSTLYSYVSRGLIRSEETGGTTRARRYLAVDVQALQQRKEHRRNPAKAAAAALHFGDPVLESAITLIADGRLYYRGQDALALAEAHTFEEVAALLWTGTMAGVKEPNGMAGVDRSPPLPLAITPTIHALVTQGHVADALQMALLATAPTDLAAYNQAAEAVAKTGMRILLCLIALLTTLDRTTGRDKAEERAVRREGAVEEEGRAPQGATASTIAEQLQCVWAPHQPQVTQLLDVALILCADHELNASSFTARCVASTGATPYAAVVAALAALQGYKHGGATRAVALFLQAAAENPERATQERLRSSGWLPGFGHPLYPQGDPRGALLLTLAQRHCVDRQAFAKATQIIAVARQALGVEPNLDFGLTVLAQSMGLPEHAPFALFALGRTAGWIGHVIEQYQLDRLIRPRAQYIGRQPQDRSHP